MFVVRRRILLPLAVAIALTFAYYTSWFDDWHRELGLQPVQSVDDPDFFWRQIPTHYPAQGIRPFPTGRPFSLPRVQHRFPRSEPKQAKAVRLERQAAVEEAFSRCWNAYRDHAWLQDELAPISGGSKNTFGGWYVAPQSAPSFKPYT